MYDLPEVAHNNDELWQAIAAALSRAGIDGVPDSLDRTAAPMDLWTADDLLLAQTCGYPLTHALAGRVRIVATPCYAAPGCEGPDYCSVVVARSDGPRTVDALRGCRAAYNSTDSQSGYAAFRALVAPLADGGSFFSSTIETGGHAESLDAVRTGRADVCAADAVTFALIAQHRPDAVAGLCEIARTPTAPGLPLITSGSAPDDTLAALRAALREVAEQSDLADTRDALLMTGFEVLSDDAYDRILDMEQNCRSLGYPHLV